MPNRRDFRSLPPEIVQNLTRPEGHLVPGGVEALVSKLRNVRSSLDSEYRITREAYDAYVRFCSAVGIVPEDIYSKEELKEPQRENPRLQALREEMEPSTYETPERQPADIIEQISFANIERLGVLERTLRDLDDLAALLSGILERIGKAPRRNTEEVKLFVSSSENELSFRLVYDARVSTSYVA